MTNQSIKAAFERMWQHVIVRLDGFATIESLNDKQDKLTGTTEQIVGFDENGNAVATDNYYTKEEVTNLINALKSTTENITLSASTWANGIYTYLNTNITETNIIELYPTIDITTEQLEALQSANIISGTQEAGSIQLVAKGDVPTIDIPVKIVVRGDL